MEVKLYIIYSLHSQFLEVAPREPFNLNNQTLFPKPPQPFTQNLNHIFIHLKSGPPPTLLHHLVNPDHRFPPMSTNYCLNQLDKPRHRSHTSQKGRTHNSCTYPLGVEHASTSYRIHAHILWELNMQVW